MENLKFRDFLLEVAKEAVLINWTKKGKELFGKFNVKDQAFSIEITILDKENTTDKDYVEVFQFKFYRNNETKMFNDNKYVLGALGVVPTIKVALDYAVKILNPDVLVFAASDNSKARKSLYKLEAAKLASKYKYHDITRNEQLHNLGYAEFVFGLYKSEDIMKKLLKDL